MIVRVHKWPGKYGSVDNHSSKLKKAQIPPTTKMNRFLVREIEAIETFTYLLL